jgi:uncharacterized membrane protein
VNIVGSSTFEEAKLVLLSPWGSTGLVLALLAAAAALALTAYGYRHQPRWSVRLLLTGLRALSVAAVLALVVQPAVQMRNVTRVPNHVAVLVDLSRSMAVREERNGPTRLERSQQVLVRSVARFAAWKRHRAVDLFGFGAALRPLGPIEGLRASDPATQMQSALGEVRRRYRGQDLAGVVLISDGIDNGTFGTGALPSASLSFLQRLQVPVHTLWVGRPEMRDLALAEVYADDFAFVRNAVQVEADLMVHGLDDVERVPVTLETGGTVVARREVHLRKGVSRYRVQFEFVPPRVDTYVYTISAPIYPGEALRDNNSRSFLLRVIRDRVRVLQVCGRPSWDERFLRQLLKRDPNVDLISFFILRTPADLALVPPTELSLIPFPTEELFEKELGSFDLVILQNFNYKPYGIGVYLPHLRRYVENGGGLAMIGGDLSFSSGEYAETPLAEVLPVRLLPDLPDRSRLVSVEDFRPRITPEGTDHPILQLGPSRRETQRILGSLPALAGVNLVAGAMPGATVLAAHPSLKGVDGRPMPVLACGEVSRGRSCALTTDTSWHWAFLSVGAGGSRQPYDRFWRNAIRWLIQDPELKYLRVILQQDSIRLGSSFRATIRAYNPDYSPARNLKVAYEIERVGGGKALATGAVTDSDGEIHVEHRPTAVGPYRIGASADLGGRRTTEDALVLVDPAGAEEREPRATPVVLKQIAEATGGTYLGQATSLPDLALHDPRVLHVNWRKDVELWSRWWSLGTCILLLGLEWLLRRRFGYL